MMPVLCNGLLTKNGPRARSWANWIGLVLLGFLLSASLQHANGQTTTAQVSGSVMDANGALIPGTSVTATNIDTGFFRKTVSNSTGIYTLNLLPPGRYKIVFEKPGFSLRTDENIVLTVGESLTLDAPLATGAANETVAVQADVQVPADLHFGTGHRYRAEGNPRHSLKWQELHANALVDPGCNAYFSQPRRSLGAK